MGDDKPVIKKPTRMEQFDAQIEKCGFTGDVLVIGHSWVNGVTEYRKPKALEAMLAENGMPLRVDAIAVDGADNSEIAHALDKIMQKAPAKQYRAVVVMAGTNDLGDPAGEVVKGMLNAYHKAEKLGRFVLLTNIHPYEPLMGKINEVNQMLLDMADKPGGVPVHRQLDLFNLMETLGDRKLHPKSYVPVREEIVRAIGTIKYYQPATEAQATREKIGLVR